LKTVNNHIENRIKISSDFKLYLINFVTTKLRKFAEITDPLCIAIQALQ